MPATTDRTAIEQTLFAIKGACTAVPERRFSAALSPYK